MLVQAEASSALVLYDYFFRESVSLPLFSTQRLRFMQKLLSTFSANKRVRIHALGERR